MEYTIPQEQLEAHKNPAELSRAKISADYVANKVMGRKEARKHLDFDKVKGTEEKEKTQEDLKTVLNNGGKGIDLTFGEACLIYGIAYLFSQYEPHPPHIACTEKELYQALRDERKFDGRQRQRLGDTLEDLSKKEFPLYWTEYQMVEGKKVKTKWITFGSLFELAWGFWDDGEFQETPSRENFELYRIELNEKIFGRIDQSFRMVDPNIGREIRKYRKKQKRNGRASKYDIRLYDLLLNQNKAVITRNYLRIAQAPMLMDNMIKNRKQRDIRDQLSDIYKMYYHMGYLTNFKIDQMGTRHKVDVLYLNPEKFYGLRDVKK